MLCAGINVSARCTFVLRDTGSSFFAFSRDPYSLSPIYIKKEEYMKKNVLNKVVSHFHKINKLCVYTDAYTYTHVG